MSNQYQPPPQFNPPPGGYYQQPPQEQQRKGCWGRNWKWMVPVGCLGLILAGVALLLGIFAVAMSAIKSSEVYQGALKVAQTHPAAVERLGQPIDDGWLVKGNINVNAAGGNANFEIPLSGPKKSGTLHVRAVSPSGAWMYERLDLAVEGGDTVSLLDRNVALPQGSPADVEEDADGSAGADDSGAAAGEDSGESGDDTGEEDAADGGVLDAKAASKPAPAYPALAKAAHASGTVNVRVVVDETGGVTSAEAVSGHPLLRPAAVAAARAAKFPPTVRDGRPVKVRGVLTYNFAAEQ
ncbi:MAG TPA: cytochrome c oxidase assembly factor Coa1 family protein [Pyrinomonadaceae bacterium]|jgi:TonB family protein